MDEIKLHDIKSIIDVQEYSLYYLLGVVFLTIVLASIIAYLLYLWYKKRNAFNIRKEHFKFMAELPFKDAKQSAYAMTFYGATFKNDTAEHTQIYENLLNRLQEYKYKKEVKDLDEETLKEFNFYREMCNV